MSRAGLDPRALIRFPAGFPWLRSRPPATFGARQRPQRPLIQEGLLTHGSTYRRRLPGADGASDLSAGSQVFRRACRYSRPNLSPFQERPAITAFVPIHSDGLVSDFHGIPYPEHLYRNSGLLTLKPKFLKSTINPAGRRLRLFLSIKKPNQLEKLTRDVRFAAPGYAAQSAGKRVMFPSSRSSDFRVHLPAAPSQSI
jgi:hypothetical protein